MRFPFENEDTMVQLSIYIHFCGTKIPIRKKNTEGFCIIQVDDNGFCKPVTHNHK